MIRVEIVGSQFSPPRTGVEIAPGEWQWTIMESCMCVILKMTIFCSILLTRFMKIMIIVVHSIH